MTDSQESSTWWAAVAAGAGLLLTALAAILVMTFGGQSFGQASVVWTVLAFGAFASIALAAAAWAVHRDSERKTRLLRASEARLAAIAVAEGGWLWEIDPAGVFTWCGDRVEAVLGYAPQELLGRQCSELGLALMPQGDLPRPHRAEIAVAHRDGGTLLLACASAPVFEPDGRLRGRCGICCDITGSARDANKLRALEEDVSQADKAGLLDYVLSSVAHELNQPLAAVSAYCSASLRMLRESPGSIDEVAGALTAASHQARTAAQVVKRMRGFMLRREPRISSCSLDDLLGDALALAAIRVQQEDVQIERSLAPGLPAVRVDAILLVQVVLNLLYNAIDAMSGRDVRRIGISADLDGEGWVRVAISDTGTGITADTLARVFDPYFTTKPEGLGLGLPICVSILEAHGSTLELERNEAGGCTARFRLEPEVLA